MSLNFVQRGDDEITESQRSALNTSRFLSPNSKEPIRIVPLVALENAGNEQPIVSYQMFEIWWDVDEVDALKETLSEDQIKLLRKKSEFPMISSDPEIDPGSWLLANPEVVENCDVKVSTRYRKSEELAIKKKRVFMMPVLWLNDPSLEEGQPPFEPKMFKFTQSTIYEGLKAFHNASGGKFKHHIFSVAKEENKPRYSVMPLEAYGEHIPFVDIDAEEMITMTTRSEIEAHLAVYGINIPPVPDNKLQALSAIEGTDDVDDEWEEE